MNRRGRLFGASIYHQETLVHLITAYAPVMINATHHSASAGDTHTQKNSLFLLLNMRPAAHFLITQFILINDECHRRHLYTRMGDGRDAFALFQDDPLKSPCSLENVRADRGSPAAVQMGQD